MKKVTLIIEKIWLIFGIFLLGDVIYQLFWLESRNFKIWAGLFLAIISFVMFFLRRYQRIKRDKCRDKC